MRKIYAALTGVVFGLACTVTAQTDFSNASIAPEPVSDTQVMLQAVEATTPISFATLPQNQRYGTFWSAQHAPGSREQWPPLPGNAMNLPVWALGDGTYLLDDRNVDYVAIRAEAEAEAVLAAAVSPMLRMSMMASSLSSSYAYSNPVYLTNLTAVASGYGTMTASFSIAGGTNFVPYDILTTTNLAMPRENWNWLGLGYTSNNYTFNNQSGDQAFYLLAKPAKTMTVAWGENYFNQCDVPNGLTNAVMVAGGGGYTVALLNDGTAIGWGGRITEGSIPTNLTGIAMIASGIDHKVALLTNGTVLVWGYNFYGENNLPTDLTNATVISAQFHHTLALRKNGTVVSWGDPAYPALTNLPTNLTNVVAIAAGGLHNLAVKADGTVAAWGDNSKGQCTIPTGMSNVVDVAAGWMHSVALKKDGTITLWGDNALGELNVPTGLSNVVAIAAAGYPSDTGYTIALRKDGTVVTWGANYAALPLNGLSNVIAIGAEYDSGLAIRTGPPTPVVTLEPVDQYKIAGGTASFSVRGQGLYGVTYQWQTNSVNLSGATNTTLTLTNVQMAQQMAYRAVITDLAGNGSIASSNAALTLVTAPIIVSQSPMPTNQVLGTLYQTNLTLSVVATAPGMNYGFPLHYQWRVNGANIPSANSNNYSITASFDTTNNYTVIVTNAAGSVSAAWQVNVTNATINVTNDLLLIYNTNSAASTTVLNYYLAHRPNVSGANVLGIGFSGIFISYASGTNYAGANPYTALTNTTVYETITYNGFTNQILAPVQAWLNGNPTKRPQYVILFLDVPSRVDDSATSATNYPFHYPPSNEYPSASYQLATAFPNWKPFVTHINMNGTNDCIAYINKLASLGTPLTSNSPILSASAGNYGNMNYYFDDTEQNYLGDPLGLAGEQAVIQAGVSSNSITYVNQYPDCGSLACHITSGTNIAGYFCWGMHSSLGPNYAIDGDIKWSGNSGWWIIETIESYNGHRYQDDYGNYIKWYSPNAFGGTNYSNTPIGAVSNTDEPGLPTSSYTSIYFGLWASGKNLGICGWSAVNTTHFQVVGDPLITK